MSVAVVLSAASSVTQRSVTLNADVFIISGSTPGSYVFYWGTTNGGTTAASWQNSQSIGTHADGSISLAISGLTDETPYYFQVAGTNDSGTFWGSWNTSPNTSSPFSTLAFPQKFHGQTLTQLGSRVRSASLLGIWSEGTCPISLLDHFRGGIIPVYGVNQARAQILAHTTTPGLYTLPTHTWTTSTPVSRTYTPSPVANQIIGGSATSFGLVPPSFDFSAPTDGDAWTLNRGAWKLVCSVNVNASFYNTNPAVAGVQGGPYPMTIAIYPYSVQGRPKRAFPPITYTDSVASGGATKTHRFVLRSDCFWLCTLTLTVWAQQTNQGTTVSNVDIASFDITATRT